jgi:hypothetical protein
LPGFSDTRDHLRDDLLEPTYLRVRKCILSITLIFLLRLKVSEVESDQRRPEK